jgi:hypothetical protein
MKATDPIEIKNECKIPEIFDLDIDSLPNKPWRKEGENISDYFNYG